MCPADFITHTHFLHLSQLYMLSPGKRNNANLNSGKILLFYTQALQQKKSSIFLVTFKFICSEEGSEAILQSYHGPPKPTGDTGDYKAVGREKTKRDATITTTGRRLNTDHTDKKAREQNVLRRQSSTKILSKSKVINKGDVYVLMHLEGCDSTGSASSSSTKLHESCLRKCSGMLCSCRHTHKISLLEPIRFGLTPRCQQRQAASLHGVTQVFCFFLYPPRPGMTSYTNVCVEFSLSKKKNQKSNQESSNFLAHV